MQYDVHQQIYNLILVQRRESNKNTIKMVDDLIGSKELKQALPYGALKDMAQVFNCTDKWISRVVSGLDKGNQHILQCAADLADIETEKKEEIKKILDDYRGTNTID